MDLTNPKVSQVEKLSLCRRYFYMGFALLPFLWGVNAVWFFREAFMRTWPSSDPGRQPRSDQSSDGTSVPSEQKAMQKLVILSGIGALLYFVAFVTWIIVFSEYRTAWGAIGDRFSFNIPTGSP